MSRPLVLSLFPGIGLLDRAFEEEGFTIVRGPDVLWGGDVRRFHPPAERFDGVIGGPPCQAFSPLKNLNPKIDRHGNLIPEFERIVGAAAPAWFLMENVREAPTPNIDGYGIHSFLLQNRDLGEDQQRLRAFSFGQQLSIFGDNLRGRTPDLRRWISYAPLHSSRWKAAVTAAHGGERRTHFKTSTGGKIQRYTITEALDAQGLPPDFFETHKPQVFTKYGQLKLLAQGVPLPMGRAIARAVRRALGLPVEASA